MKGWEGAGEEDAAIVGLKGVQLLGVIGFWGIGELTTLRSLWASPVIESASSRPEQPRFMVEKSGVSGRERAKRPNAVKCC